MTEKRFRVQEHCLRSSYGIEAENWLVTNDNHSVVLNDKAEAHMVANMGNDVIDKFNHLHEEKEELKEENEYLCEKIKENEWHWNTIDEDRDVWKYKCKTLEEENEELKQELKVYRKVASCGNCNYHNYDWFDDGDEFEVCDKGNDVTEGICEDWREL